MIDLKPLNRIPTIVFLCLLYTFCTAQDKAKNTWGKISPSDFSTPVQSSVIDSNSNAVILSDEGSVHYIGSKTGWFSYVYTRHTRIRILRRKALQDEDLTRVSLRLYGRDENLEKLSNVEATTYNLEGQQLIKTSLSDKDVFLTKLDKEHTEARFTFPSVKEGSIIEYAYTITSDYWHLLPSWQFQWREYPCLFSRFEVEIPRTLSFVVVRQGIHAYLEDKGSEGNRSYRIKQELVGSLGYTSDENYSINTLKHTWSMKDIPAFGNEGFLSTPENYIDKLEFQLAGTNNGQDATYKTNTWAKATEELLEREDFGGALSTDDQQLNDLANKASAGASDPLAVARAVYYYVSQHFTCTNRYMKYVKTNLRDVIKNNSGTVGDINLLLAALLRQKGLHVDPVLLSTREFGTNLASYPILDKLNYVVIRLNLYGKTYFLDAAHPELGFGQLAANCYNGHARIISKSDSGSVWFMPDSLKEARLTTVLMSSSDKGLEGTWQTTLGKEESFRTRSEVREKGEAAYFKDIQTRWGEDMDIRNGGIDSLQRLEDPVKVHYEFLLKQTPDATIMYLPPMLGEGYRQNPFQAADRKLPVEMPYAMDDIYVLSMDIPEGYTVEEMPKSTRVSYNGDQGSFEYLVGQSGSQLQLRARLKLNRATFLPEDYSSLREFFAFVVKKENEQIVLKKK